MKALVKNIKYRWYKFDRTEKQIVDWANRKFFSLLDFDFFYVDTRTEDEPYLLKHWISSWFTQNISRKIQLSFTAFASDEENRRDLLKVVNRLFEPPQNPTDTKKWFYEMEFEDPRWNIWLFNTKVIDRPRISDFKWWQWVDIVVDLIVEWWSTIYWKTLQSFTDRNYTIWFSLPTPLWESFWEYPSPIIDYQWLSDSFVKCTITALQNNATAGYVLVRSIWVDESIRTLYINTNLNIWDKLIVDPSNNIVTLNWIDITANLELSFWNNYPVLQYIDVVWWNNQLVVDTWKPIQTISVLREYRDTRS